MRLIGFSKKARIACGGFLFTLGYWPVFNYFAVTNGSPAASYVVIEKNQPTRCNDEFSLCSVDTIATLSAANYKRLTTLQ
ncbi:MAG: hypothetical protein LBD81_03390, partial [Holosporaceae bacterium]|nr:hypothetical protein [Holosporaceae bacterium]